MFNVFNEIGIIEQLGRTRLERVMPDGLLLPHFSVLNHLTRLGDGKSLSHLAFAFEVTKGAMTNTIQRLERRGYVEVRPDPADRRGKQVFLTPAGRACREEAIARLAPTFEELAGSVGVAVFEELRPRLEALRLALDTARNVDRPSPTSPQCPKRSEP